MKHGAGAPDANPPGRRRSKRGAALLAAAATGEASSPGAAVQSGSSTSGRSRASAADGGGARRQAGARATATPRARPSGAALATGTRSSPRRPKQATRESPAAAAASAALRETSSTGDPTVVSRGATAKGSGKRVAPLSARTEAAAASAATAPSSSPLSAAAATPGSKKRRSNGGGSRGRGDIADSDAAMEMLATLLSPVAAAREEPRAPTEQTQEDGRERSAAALRQTEYTSSVGGGGEEDPSPCPLEAMFLALEQVLPLFRRRRQASLLKQVRPAVEGMCGRSFTRQHLARIVYVQPDAYKLSSKTDARPTRGGYRLRDLLIEIGPSPTLEAEDGERDAAAAGERRGGMDGRGGSAHRSRGGSSSSAADGSRGSKAASGEAASARRREVFCRLLSSAKSRHCKCGRGGRSGNPTANGQRGVEEECSCLPEAPLPDTSPVPVDGISGGGGDSRGLAADESVAGPSLGSSSLSSTPEARGRGEAAVGGGVDYDVGGSDAPKSVESLRERLRQKDARSAKERNKSVLEKEADRRRKGNLPAMADAVRSYFAHSGRTTCSLDALVEALSSSSKHALSPKEARDRVRMISALVPEWCTIIAPPAATGGSGGGGRSGGGDGGLGIPGGVDEGMVARPMKAKEVVRVNTRIRFDEVRQMIAFMAEGGGGGGGGGGKS